MAADLEQVGWPGQYEYLQRALERLRWVMPAGIIFVLIYLVSRSATESFVIMQSLPFALVGGSWLIWALGHVPAAHALLQRRALARRAQGAASDRYSTEHLPSSSEPAE